MLTWLTRHDTIVALALVGGAFSLIAWVLAGHGMRERPIARWCTGAAYAFMGASMVLFIVAGLRVAG